MGKKGETKQLKRIASGRKVKVLKKISTWLTKPRTGPHSPKEAVALLVIIRDYLKLADTAKEAKKIIKQGKVLVDGRKVTDHKFPVGFMDLIQIPELGKNYRVMLDKKGRIIVEEIETEANFKLVRVNKKRKIKGGKILLTTHDGRNLTFDKDQEYKVGEVFKITVPEQKIVERFELKPGNLGYVINGKHAGKIGKIIGIKEGTMTRKPEVVLQSEKETFNTIKDYVFVIGKEEPAVKI